MIEYYYCTTCHELTPSVEIYRIVNTDDFDEEGDFYCDHICQSCFNKLQKERGRHRANKVVKLKLKKGKV